ncbi:MULTISPECIES: ABC transporter substrate-binding protein [Streptosporangium]|uniref:Multiple sugar transport system substrate-binding protein n=1 Tax=Streptosporangium brasiliense TaxID=47480 RepID=A0ABT9RND4_9ACTN|nr:sugar ABC transporter substrate-binding protein [Streptosporangium brasiliense]MDP9870229.1 multiple sugar transport system substrate-binding protein [Streptosporangium brasiliense]
MRRLHRLAIPLVGVLTMTPVGCGSDNDAGTVRLRMIESLTSPDRTKLIRQLLSDFERQNPGIKVELVSPPLENADRKITQVLQTKKDLDVLEVRDHTAKSFSNNGWLAEIPVQSWPGWSGLTELARKKAVEVGGKPYLIPYGFYEKVLFYRSDWLREAGVAQPPTTWQEVYDTAKKLTDKGRRRYGYSFRGGKGGFDYAVLIVSAFNGDKVDPGRSFFLKDGRTIWSTPEAAQAMNLFLSLFKEASPADSVSWSFPEMVQGFTANVTGMLIQDPEVIKTVEESGIAKDGWSTVPIPKGPGGYALQPVGYAGWGVTSFSTHKAEAVKLVEFLSADAQSTKFAKGNSLIPIATAAQQDPQFSGGAWKAYLDAQQDDKQVITVRPVDYPGWSEWQQAADKDIQSLLTGDRTVADVLSAWDAFWTDQAKKKTS